MRAAVIQEFGISITAVDGDEYLVRTENVEKGVQLAEERVTWPIAQWLEQTKSLMHDPLLGLLQGQKSRTIPSRASATNRVSIEDTPDLATLVQLGQTLHNELFQGQLRDSWIMAQGVAQNHQDLLRLRIGMKDNRLQQLPWEALHAGTRPLATGTDVIFSRYILDPRQEHSIPQAKAGAANQVLRILMVIASPEDQERLELKQEVRHLQAELQPDSPDPHNSLVDVQLKILEQPGRAELTQALERGNYQVLHYAGHSNLGNAGGDLYLVSRQSGLTERLSGEDLAGLLVNNGIKLAVVNSCRGGYSSSSEEGWQERNLAQALVNRGMPSVIAMAERIPDHVSITFTELLYRNLKKGQSIDLSLNRTRQGLISAYGSNQFYWALPTLYMHPLYDGYLVKTTDNLENPTALDSANDPFGDIFSEPGMGEVDLPSRTRPPVSSATRSQQPNSQQPTSQSSGTAPDSQSSTSNLVDSNEANANSQVLKQLSSPLSSDDVDGELRVPQNIEAPEGFYGEPGTVAPAMPTIEPTDKKSVHESVSKKAASATAKSGRAPDDSDAAPEMVGERLTRSHTLHTKLLTAPGIASLALVALFGVMTVPWVQRGFSQSSPARSRDNVPEVLSDLGLPAQIEVALSQNDLDAASAAAKALINQGQFEQALTALQTASPEQEEDVIIAFLTGRAHWSLAKQGDDLHSPSDAMRSWVTALESESDWMEIVIALGFAQYEIGREDLALETWERAIALANKQPDARGYFSEKAASEYSLNAHAGVAMAALSLSKIEANAQTRNELIAQASESYRLVIDQAAADFTGNTLGNDWLWFGGAIADWDDTKKELSQTISAE